MPWGDSVPVDTPDLAVIGVSTVAEVSLALVALYVVTYRSWPGYIAKNCELVLYTALAVSRCCLFFLHTGMFRLRFEESNMFLEAPRVFRFLLVAWQLVHSRCQHSVHAKYLISRNLCYVGWWRLLAHVSPKQFLDANCSVHTVFSALDSAVFGSSSHPFTTPHPSTGYEPLGNAVHTAPYLACWSASREGTF